MFDVNGWELVIIVVVALLVIGPERLPQYVARLREWIRDLKRLADGARSQLRDQMGPEFDDIDWSAYDPRQYD
ncbi:MAG: twin-arginine translocase TatA/TatE family subunit, partial [Micrococcales bacterium]|nr:twin-arginine translocase TatA/TatE family subunit [Micrococcales bacterium]